MALETAGWPMRSCRAAPENEPVSTTQTNASMADKRFIAILRWNAFCVDSASSPMTPEWAQTQDRIRPVSGLPCRTLIIRRRHSNEPATGRPRLASGCVAAVLALRVQPAANVQPDNIIRFGRHLLFAHDFAGIVDDAHRRLLHRNIKTHQSVIAIAPSSLLGDRRPQFAHRKWKGCAPNIRHIQRRSRRDSPSLAYVVARVGAIWASGDGDELRNVFTRTAQPGLWFIGGSFAQCRIYSKYLAVQIRACTWLDLPAFDIHPRTAGCGHYESAQRSAGPIRLPRPSARCRQ